MQKESVSSVEDEILRPACDNWTPSIFQNSKKDDVVFFRMDTPTQLEKEYDFGPVLGEGSFGIVYRGRRKRDDAKCAIKKIPRERTFSASERARLDREISILRYVKHPGIIELYAVAESPTFLFLITELCEGNSLAKCVSEIPEGYGFEEYIVVDIVKQVASALSYLHNRGIVHRDLKAGNIMLLKSVVLDRRKIPENELRSIKKSQHAQVKAKESSSDSRLSVRESVPSSTLLERNITKQPSSPHSPAGRPISRAATAKTRKQNGPNSLSANPKSRKSAHLPIPISPYPKESVVPMERKLPPTGLRTKLIDFGLAVEVRKNEEALASACGTPLYMAPEVLNGRFYTRQCDVWSLGILMFILLTNRSPFSAQTEEELVTELNNLNIQSIIQNLSFLSPLCQSCLLRVLNMDPAYRYSASELLLDPWCMQYDCEHRSTEVIPTDAFKIHHDYNNEHDANDNGGEDDDSAFKSIREPNLDSRVKSPSSVNVAHRSLHISGSRPASIGVSHSGSTYSATNVLELMKQYHKELTGAKRDPPSEEDL